MAILSEVYFGAAIEQVAPALYRIIVVGTQIVLRHLGQALFAVQIMAAYASNSAAIDENVQKFCDDIKTRVLDGIFIRWLGELDIRNEFNQSGSTTALNGNVRSLIDNLRLSSLSSLP